MPKIGVGVITTGKREIKDYLLGPESTLVVFQDTKRSGASYSRNNLLKHFHENGYDYWFVFDDDCYPVKHGWESYFIEQSEKSGIPFFGVPEFFSSPFLGVVEGTEVAWWESGYVQFGMYTPQIMEAVGYFSEFSKYGFEDDEYVRRTAWSGVTKAPVGVDKALPCPIRVLSYIHPMDMYGEQSPLEFSLEERDALIAEAHPLWWKAVHERVIFRGFDVSREHQRG